MYKCEKGTFEGLPQQNTIDRLREWCFKHFSIELQERPSLHKYVNSLPRAVVTDVNELRQSTIIKERICSQFGGKCDVIPMDETDELYVSHVNKDKGGDQGLFDKHYDGTLRFLKGSTVVRALIYLSSSGGLKVVFNDSNVTHNFKTYEFGLLDFHREYHWVEGDYDPDDTPRVLLKCNYLVCNGCSAPYVKVVRAVNEWIFFIVKYSMEYSKSPKTPLQQIIGFFCNFFRKVNNVSPIASMLTGVVLLCLLLCPFLLTGLAVVRYSAVLT